MTISEYDREWYEGRITELTRLIKRCLELMDGDDDDLMVIALAAEETLAARRLDLIHKLT